MKIRCTCGRWHDISPTGLAVVIDAFQAGDLMHVNRTSHLIDGETVSGYQLSAACLLDAFVDEDRIRAFRRRYKGNQIVVEQQHL